MSRPIFEPSLPRADQALAWGSRQLFRRPAPTGSETGDAGEYAWMTSTNVTICAQDTWVRVELPDQDFSGPAGDPFDIVTDGIEVAGGKYVVDAAVYWDGFAETGMCGIGGAAGDALVFMRTHLAPTLHTCSGSWNMIAGTGESDFFLSTVYLWAYQSTSPAAHALGHVKILEIL